MQRLGKSKAGIVGAGFGRKFPVVAIDFLNLPVQQSCIQIVYVCWGSRF
ncbi:hypothetical protein [Chroococcidiopsis sp. CCNUC1]|nr:hypothetical protein [Chroococcidiopsis sp. CCNUC1]URD50401.1 hypothetical protein M5J74_00025 [Chroococcidiopsis sp. CCNUC1]